MTYEQLLRELRSVPPREIDEWMALRHGEIMALSDVDRRCVEDATMKLRDWLRHVSLLSQKL